jgi:hypothetical protein
MEEIMKALQKVLRLLLFTVLFAAAAGAQTATPLMRVSIPFEFQVGSKSVPAGNYTVVRAAPYILALRDSDDRVVAAVATTPAQALTPPAATKLVFRVLSERNMLTQLWLASSRYGYEFASPHSRTVLAKASVRELQAKAGR